jgi:methanogenic corrinoid protein MtbC1
MLDEKLYPVRVVVARTGLSGHGLRAWERHYGIIEPVRSSTNRRLYRESDIDRLQRIVRALANGHRIGDLAAMPRQDIDAVLATYVPEEGRGAIAVSADEEFLVRANKAVADLDSPLLLSILEQASVHFHGHALFEELVLPLVRAIGDRWREGSLRVAHEHLALATIRTFLGGLWQTTAGDSDGPEIVAGTLSGQQHEIGALIVSYLAALQGWSPVYLGPSLPAEELATVARTRRAAVVAITPGMTPALMLKSANWDDCWPILPPSPWLRVGGMPATIRLHWRR